MFSSFPRRRAAAVLLAAAVLSAPAVSRGQEKNTDPDPPGSPQAQARDALREGRPEEAARILKSIDFRTLTEEGQRRWRLRARDAALRTGDGKWLEEVNDYRERYAFADAYVIAIAWNYLKSADFKTARFYLKRLRAEHALNERDKRRKMSLEARLAQLEGDRKLERQEFTRLVGYASRWASETCQSCHANPKQPGKMTHLNLERWWGAERLAEIYRRDGDAAKVRDLADRELAAKPDDDFARVRLALAWKALGDEAKARETLRRLPWTEYPDRELVKPVDLIMFP